jgi:hypothetical protein
MTEVGPLQVRVNALLSEVLFAAASIDKLRRRLEALKGDMDPRDYSAAVESWRRGESAVATIRQVAERIDDPEEVMIATST